MIGCVNEKQKVIKRTSEVSERLVLGSDRARKWLGSVRMSDRLC